MSEQPLGWRGWWDALWLSRKPFQMDVESNSSLPVRGAERIVWKTAFEDGWEVYLSAKPPVGMQRGWRSV